VSVVVITRDDASRAWALGTLRGMPSAPTLLALDTATDTLHLALLAGRVARVRQGEGGASASATLVPLLQELLDEAELPWAALDAVAFGRGPGAFTGLRTAAAVAQGLALGANKPVIAIDTLLAVAEDARQSASSPSALPLAASPSLVWAATDARMGELYAAAYRWCGTHWHSHTAPQLLHPQAWVEHVQRSAEAAPDTPLTVAGNALLAHADALHALPAHATRRPLAAPRGTALLALAQAAWQAGDVLDAAQALPLYVRDKVAQTTAEREAARARA